MRNFCFLFILTTLSAFSNHLFAQNQFNIWYFGNYAGLDFNGGPPIALTNGQINTTEGCATISDATGNLLFYTDGSTIWNQNHLIMPNGTGLLGNISSTQSALIVPKPGSSTIYYIFTVSSLGLYYSELDMNLDGGLGDINNNKNIILLNGTSEKLTAVLHNNNSDIWVLTKKSNTPDYYSYLVSHTGVNSSPIISNGGASGTGVGIGYMKVSPDGKKVGVCNRYNNIELFDFDDNTGQLTYQLSIPQLNPPNGLGSYGIEFSPSNQFCYWTEQGGGGSMMFQIDLTAGSNTDIINSRYVVDSSDRDLYAIQLAPDGKIYCADYQSDYMHVIHAPDNWGANCNFQTDVVFLQTGRNNIGLPNFAKFNLQDGFTAEFYCLGDSTQFSITNPNVDSVLWYFDDINSGTANTSTELNPAHLFSDTGSYTVSLVIYRNGQWVSISETISITAYPSIDLGLDTFLCESDSLLLNGSYPNATYLWSDNSSDSTLKVDSTGTYMLRVSVNGCSSQDSLNVIFAPCSFNADSFCTGNATQFSYTYNQADSVLWNFDDPSSGTANLSYALHPTHLFSAAGNYSIQLTIYQNNQQLSFSQNILMIASPYLDLGVDTTLCENESILLDAGIANNYSWNDNSSNPTLLVSSAGNYAVTVNNHNCSAKDSILINYQNCIPCSISIPNAFSPNEDGVNDRFAPVMLGNCDLNQYRLEIYNRWGQQVYHSDDKNNAWDGRFQNVLQPQEVYLYRLYYELDNDLQQEKRHLKGEITLLN